MSHIGFNSLVLALMAASSMALAQSQPQSGAIVDRTPLAQTTAKTIVEDYGIEREGRAAPKVGLALAGGGTRAGYFAHGVLQGLNDTGLLDRVDVISSVSGGSYAAYWYFSKRLEAQRLGFSHKQIFDDCLPAWWVDERKAKAGSTGRTLKALMDQALSKGSPRMPACTNTLHWEPGDPYRWQAHLARWPDMFNRTPGFVSGNAQGAPVLQVAAEAPAFLVELFARPLIENSNIPLEYHYGIERVWGLNPQPRVFAGTPVTGDDARTKWAYTNALGKAPSRDMHVDPAFGGWEALRTQYRKDPTLPLWILNSTQGQKGPTPDSRHIYEMTPLSHGATGHRYRIESPELAGVPDLGTATLASAAFADRQGVNNPRFASAMGLHKALTWGIDIQDRFSPAPSQRLHLSDGGGSEDLGLYSLLKRRIPDIIVVDDASDQIGRMDDLCWVRAAVAQDVPGSEMRFPALKNFEAVCKTWEDADQHKNKGKVEKRLVYNTSAWLNPVVKGTVTWPDVNGEKIPPTRLWLVKLGWHQQDFRRAFNAADCGSAEHAVNCFLATYYGHNTATVNEKDGYMVFPHLSTPGATYNASSYLFWAYRELGRMVSSELSWTDAGGGGLALRSGKPQCTQEAMAFKGKGRRPQFRPASASAEAGCVPADS
jgi:hypothetical protein